MKKIFFFLFISLNVFSQSDILKIENFYFEEFPYLKTFINNREELNTERLNSLFEEINNLPKVNSGNSKFYKQNDKTVFEIHGDNHIRIKVINNIKEEEYIFYSYSGGKVKHEIPYKNQKVNGTYKVFFDNSNRILFETNYINGIKEGKRKFNTPYDDVIVEGNYKNGKIEGKIKIIDPERKRHILYPGNLEYGIVKHFDLNSNLYLEVPFINTNIIHGQVKIYSDNKNWISNHSNGVLDGTTEYLINGILKYSYSFKAGKPIGEHKIFDTNDRLRQENFYDENGTKTGVWKTYDTFGRLTSELPYLNGQKNGVEYTYSNGFLKSTREYKNDKLNGVWKHLNIFTQNVESESVLVDDLKISTIFYFKNEAISRKFEFNSKGQTIKAEYYTKEGNLFYERKYNSNKTSEGITKSYYLDEDENYFLNSEVEFDENEFKIREKIFTGNNNYVETRYKNNICSSKTIFKDNITTMEYYHYSRKITFEEFEKCSN